MLIPVVRPDRLRYRLLHNHLDVVLTMALRTRTDMVTARVGMPLHRAAHPGRLQRTGRPALLPGLFGFLHGHVLNELQKLPDNPDETDDLLGLGLHRLPIAEFPVLRGLAPVLSAYDGAAELERGADILLTGLATTVTPRPPPKEP